MVTELHAGRDEATENLKTKQKVEASHCMATTGCEAEINTSVQEGSEGEGISKSSTHDGDAWSAGKRKVTFAPMRSVYSYVVSPNKWDQMHRKPYDPDNLKSCPDISRSKFCTDKHLLDGKSYPSYGKPTRRMNALSVAVAVKLACDLSSEVYKRVVPCPVFWTREDDQPVA